MHVRRGEGREVDLGVVRMRLLAGGEGMTGMFSMAEFTGGAGRWTVPHVHERTQESFFVLDGSFVFHVGDEQLTAEPGDYVVVAPGVPHVMTAGDEGGRFLTLWAPGGNEEMFFELGSLGPDALRDPSVRAAVSAKYDSVPVQAQEHE